MSSPKETTVQADFTETIDVSFQNVQYIVTVSTVQGENLTIEVECKHDANRWRGDFTSKYIEDITSKTGNFKKYPVFVRMLLSALKQGSDSVFVDLLTYADLEMLKARKEKANGASSQRPFPANNKRYLILTYAAEFDRVHFPLPLLYEDNPDPETLKKTISALRADVESLQEALDRGGAGEDPEKLRELRSLREENAALRSELSRACTGYQHASMGQEVQRLTTVAKEAEKELRLMRKERDMLVERVGNAETQLERERNTHRRELRRKTTEISELEAQLENTKEAARDARTKVRMLTEELDMAKRRGSIQRTRHAYGASSGAGARQAPRHAGRAPGAPHYQRGPSPGARRPSSQPSSRTQSPRIPSGAGRQPNGGAASGRRPTSAGSARAGSRPSSAGRAGRFDPTAYVQQQKERMRQRQADRGRQTFSPAGSRQSSGRSTPTRERSFDSGNRSRQGSRSNSVERRGRGSGSHDAASGRRTPDSEHRRPRGEGARPRPEQRAPGAKSEAQPARRGQHGAVRASAAQRRADSPGAALEDVKERLSQYASNSNGARETPPQTQAYGGYGASQTDRRDAAEGDEAGGSEAAARPQAHGEFDEATDEIASIDQRLHALQNFLKAAKQGGAQAGKGSR
uniref:Coiled-coil domain-containing protein 61 n=1 Tax=Tetraselmis sp. GSL018 TaxID=582737 RepID=A0A061QVB8_9CHLO